MNLFHLAFGEFSSKAFGFFTTVYLARVLGTREFGEYSLVLAVFAYGMLFANFGFETYGTREFSYTQSPDLIGGITYLRLFYAVATFVIFLVISWTVFGDVGALLTAQMANIFLVPLYLQFVFRGMGSMVPVSLSRILQSGLFFVFVILFVDNTKLILLPFLMAAATLISCIPLYTMIRKKYPAAFKVPSFATLKRIFSQSYLIGISGSIILVYLNFDTIILGIFSNSTEIAVYTVAFKIYFLGYSMIGLFYLAFLPTISTTDDPRHLGEHLRLFHSLLFLGAGYVGFGGYFISKDLIVTVFGAEYLMGVGAMKILFFSLSVSCISTALINPFQIVKNEKIFIRLHLIRTIMFLVLCLVFIPSLGMIGAAIATLVSEGVIVVVSFLYYNKHFKQFAYWTLVRYIGTGGALFLLGSFLVNERIISEAVAFIALTLFFTGFVVADNPRIALSVNS